MNNISIPKKHKLVFNVENIAHISIKMKIDKSKNKKQKNHLIFECHHNNLELYIDTIFSLDGEMEIYGILSLVPKKSEIEKINISRAFSNEFRRFSSYNIDIYTKDPNLKWFKSFNLLVCDKQNLFTLFYPKDIQAFEQDKDDSNLLNLNIDMKLELLEDFTPRNLDDWSPRIIERQC